MARPTRPRPALAPTAASASAIIRAAPAPWAVRAAISETRSSTLPHRVDAKVNRVIPASNRRRRPNRSPSRPALTTSDVTASKYASTTHCTDAVDASNTRARVGKPTLAMLVPSDDNNIVSARLARVQFTRDASRRTSVVGSEAAVISGSEVRVGDAATLRATENRR